jgi:hypothetical protein
VPSLVCEPNSAFMPSLVYEPNSVFAPSSDCEPYSTFVSSPVLVSSSDDDSEDENPPPLSHLPLDESLEPAPAPSPPLSRWVISTREAVGDLVDDPSYQRQTCS